VSYVYKWRQNHTYGHKLHLRITDVLFRVLETFETRFKENHGAPNTAESRDDHGSFDVDAPCNCDPKCKDGMEKQPTCRCNQIRL
jgi:hypothetical protein